MEVEDKNSGDSDVLLVICWTVAVFK